MTQFPMARQGSEWDIGTLDPVEVLLEYDAPLAFTFRDVSGSLGLAYLSEPEPGGPTLYLLVPISDSLLSEIVQGLLPIRRAFNDRVWVASVDESGQVTQLVCENASDLASRYLPSESLRIFSKSA